MCKYTDEDFDNPAIRADITPREFTACGKVFTMSDMVGPIGKPKPESNLAGGIAAIVIVFGLMGLGWLAKHMFSTLKKA